MEEKKPLRLKIIGDGTSANTHIIDEETGRELELVKAMRIRAHADKPFVECFLKILNVKLELDARESKPEPTKHWPLHCVVCGRVITRPQVIDAIRKRIAEDKNTNHFVVKCSECETELGVTMGKGLGLKSVDLGPND